MSVESRALRYFVAVAEELNFSRAAERGHLSQPALSQQIQRLEDEIGVKLFERDKRTVALTVAGNALLINARAALGHIEQGVMAAREAGGVRVNALRIGVTEYLTLSLGAELFKTFLARHPGISLRTQDMFTPAQLVALREGRLDAGFVTSTHGLRENDDLAFAPLIREGYDVWLPEDDPLTVHDELSLESLSGVPLVLHERAADPAFVDHLLTHFRTEGFEPHVVAEINIVNNLMTSVAAGVGLGISPRTTRFAQRAGVVPRPLRGVNLEVGLDIVWRRDHQARRLREFIAVTREVFGVVS